MSRPLPLNLILRAVVVTAACTLVLSIVLLLGARALMPAPEQPDPGQEGEQLGLEAQLRSLRALLAEEPFGPEPRSRAAELLRAPPRSDAAIHLQEQLRQRIELTAARTSGLRARLRALDSALPIDDGLRADLRAFAELAERNDEDLRSWQEKVITVDRLRQRLAAFQRGNEPEPGLRAALDQLAGLVGATDTTVADLSDWFARYDACADSRAALAILDLVAPIPSDAQEHLEAVAAALGADWGPLPRWRSKLAEVRRLKSELLAIHEAFSPDPHLAGVLRELLALVGERDPDVIAGRERSLQLVGPQRPAWASDFGRDERGTWCELRINDESLRLRYLPPGSFTMGSPMHEAGRDRDERQVSVSLSRGFWIAETETPQRFWQTLMPLDQPRFRDPDYPVLAISWRQAVGFCQELTLHVDGLWARLPTEAEWEYAARAGHLGPFVGHRGSVGAFASESIADLAWHRGNSDGRPHAVGFLEPNPLGLRDLHGNVWEWCADVYGPYPDRPVSDPLGVAPGGRERLRVLRGGSFNDRPDRLRVANRHSLAEIETSIYVGFRLVIDAQPYDERERRRRQNRAELAWLSRLAEDRTTAYVGQVRENDLLAERRWGASRSQSRVAPTALETDGSLAVPERSYLESWPPERYSGPFPNERLEPYGIDGAPESSADDRPRPPRRRLPPRSQRDVGVLLNLLEVDEGEIPADWLAGDDQRPQPDPAAEPPLQPVIAKPIGEPSPRATEAEEQRPAEGSDPEAPADGTTEEVVEIENPALEEPQTAAADQPPVIDDDGEQGADPGSAEDQAVDEAATGVDDPTAENVDALAGAATGVEVPAGEQSEEAAGGPSADQTVEEKDDLDAADQESVEVEGMHEVIDLDERGDSQTAAEDATTEPADGDAVHNQDATPSDTATETGEVNR